MPELAAPPVGVNVNWPAMLQQGASITAVSTKYVAVVALHLSLMYTPCYLTFSFNAIKVSGLIEAHSLFMPMEADSRGCLFMIDWKVHPSALSSSQCKQNLSHDESPSLNG